jgi:flagellar protein FlgJ
MPALPSNLSTGASDAKLAADGRNLDALRYGAAKNPKSAAADAAKQFESLFMTEMLKSMRAATESSGMLDNAGTKLGTEMLDAQLAAKTAGRPGGLSEVIQQQLERQMGLVPGPIPSTKRANDSLPTVAAPDATPKVPEKSAAGFVRQHMVSAEKAAAETGIPAHFMIAQSALETGWGKREIIGRDGTNSHNLFGIKAGGSWNGPTVDVTTTEYIGGQPRKVTQSFRAYANAAESFADYAKLMKESPRYAKVMEKAGDAKAFAMGLQKAGYATDPQYGDKLGKVINTTLRLQRDLA